MQEVGIVALSEYEQRVFTEIEADLSAETAWRKSRLRRISIVGASVVVVAAAGFLIWLAMAAVLPRASGVVLALAVGVCIGALGSMAWSRRRFAWRRYGHIARRRSRPPHGPPDHAPPDR